MYALRWYGCAGEGGLLSERKKVVYQDHSDGSDIEVRPNEFPSSFRCRRPQRRTAATSCGERVDLSSDSKAVWARDDCCVWVDKDVV